MLCSINYSYSASASASIFASDFLLVLVQAFFASDFSLVLVPVLVLVSYKYRSR